MKKLLILVTCFILLSTNLSFASPDEFTNSINELANVDNRLYMIINEITGDEPLNKDHLYKDIKFCHSILSSRSKIISNIYSNNSDLESAKTCASLLYTISLYELSLASLNVYVDNDTKADNFIDACAAYQNANISLNALKGKHKIQTQINKFPKCEESFN